MLGITRVGTIGRMNSIARSTTCAMCAGFHADCCVTPLSMTAWLLHREFAKISYNLLVWFKMGLEPMVRVLLVWLKFPEHPRLVFKPHYNARRE
jgi:hypothetical protein